MLDGSKNKPDAQRQHHAPLLYEMIRSFVSLADHLNLTRAVEELKSTRQTVRRHIAQLEELRGKPLFTVRDRRYELTEEGAAALSEAEDLVARMEAWSLGKSIRSDGLQHLTQSDGQGWRFYLKQQPIHTAWKSSTQLLPETLRAWAVSGGQIEHPAMAHIRPHLMVYRETPMGWTCIELGEHCSFVLWFGWTHARSSIGRPIGELPGGGTFARLLKQPFEEVRATNGARLDHIHTMVPRTANAPPTPASYKRLLLGGRLPDESFALLSVAEYCDVVEIPGLDPELMVPMPPDVKLPTELVTTKYLQLSES